ncbi:MAG: hypothetical protein ACJ79Q_05445 [Gemmatimonadaceae bacterium]
MAVAVAPAKKSKGPLKCRRKFLRFFPKGFDDPKYYDWERGYKWEAHLRWNEILSKQIHTALIAEGNFADVARRAVTIESRTNLLFSFEKMALRDAVKSTAGARTFAEGLYEFLYARGSDRSKFEQWCETVASLPRRQTRVLTWPLLTVFGFIAQPKDHFFLKPMVTRTAAREYGFEFDYRSRPNWGTYANLLEFAAIVEEDLRDLRPKDMIDIQSFLWVQGSDEYEE